MARKPTAVDLRLLSKVSKLYYEQKLTQQEIARRLHLSRPKVSRLLQRAQEAGLVQITVSSPMGGFADLEHQLEARFGLQEVVVVDVDHTTSRDMVARELGIAAADYLQRILQDGDIIGVTWGTTLHAMVNALRPYEAQDVHVVQLIGGLGAPEAEVHATTICRRIARLLNGKLTLIPAPGIVDSLATKQALLSDSHVQRAYERFAEITVAFVGIGVPTPESVVMRDGSIMREEQLDVVLAAGAVGDIGLRFFDANGQPIASALDDLVIGISLAQLQQIERVVGVAGGLEKQAAVCGALDSRLISVLITDHQLARVLVDCPANDAPPSTQFTPS
ncbi:MAG: sugar-binding transcriptional regulator [Chloroflexi bacterium]|nr:sugar-binding transcriptional regulator [Chloroflexota bacterium]